jgi:hypothetical protein
MSRTFFRVLVIAASLIAALASSLALSQSLGDIARENQEQKAAQAENATSPKVITNKDLPKDPDASSASSATTAPVANKPADPMAKQRAEQRAEQRYAQQRQAEQRAAEQWKRQILAQKNKVAVLQARMNQMHAAIQSSSGSVASEGPYTGYQARRVAQIQQQLYEQKRKLDQMQEAARHAGMHTAVYDP